MEFENSRWAGEHIFLSIPRRVPLSEQAAADFNHPAMSAALDRVARGVQGLVSATGALVLLQACQRMLSFTR